MSGETVPKSMCCVLLTTQSCIIYCGIYGSLQAAGMQRSTLEQWTLKQEFLWPKSSVICFQNAQKMRGKKCISVFFPFTLTDFYAILCSLNICKLQLLQLSQADASAIKQTHHQLLFEVSSLLK